LFAKPGLLVGFCFLARLARWQGWLVGKVGSLARLARWQGWLIGFLSLVSGSLFQATTLLQRRIPKTRNEKQRPEGAKCSNPFGYNRILLFFKNPETAMFHVFN
jgi:hypothetical protein